MATTNHERVGKTMELLRQGLHPFVERELQAHYGKYWVTKATERWPNDLHWDGDEPRLDASPLLRIMWEQWNDVFRKTLGFSERSLVSELRDQRNKWPIRSPSRPTTPSACSTRPPACSARSRRLRPRRSSACVWS
jgi:Swt1-like HEPN